VQELNRLVGKQFSSDLITLEFVKKFIHLLFKLIDCSIRFSFTPCMDESSEKSSVFFIHAKRHANPSINLEVYFLVMIILVLFLVTHNELRGKESSDVCFPVFRLPVIESRPIESSEIRFDIVPEQSQIAFGHFVNPLSFGGKPLKIPSWIYHIENSHTLVGIIDIIGHPLNSFKIVFELTLRKSAMMSMNLKI